MKRKQRLICKRIKSVAKYLFNRLAPDSWKVSICQGAVIHKEDLQPALIIKIQDLELKTVFDRDCLLVLTPQNKRRTGITIDTKVITNGKVVERLRWIELPLGMEYASSQDFSPLFESELSKSILMLTSIAEEVLKLTLIKHKLQLSLEEIRELYTNLNSSRLRKIAPLYNQSILQIEEQLR